MMQKTGRAKDPILGSPKCSVCGDLAVHVLKRGEIVLCDKHFGQRFRTWAGRSEGQAYNWAYNEGHSDSRKEEGYNPIKSKQDLVPFHRILKQKGAESFDEFEWESAGMDDLDIDDLPWESVADRPVWGAKTMKNTMLCTGGGHYLLIDPSHVMMLYSDGAESAKGLKKPNGQSAPNIPNIAFDGPTATKTVREMKAILKEADTLINFKNGTYATDYIKQAIMKLPINTEVTLQNGTASNYPLKMTFDFKGKTYHYLLAPRVSDDWDEKMNTSGVTLSAEPRGEPSDVIDDNKIFLDDLGQLEDDDLLPVGTKVRSYDFPGIDSSYIEGVIEKIAPSPRCSPDCMHYHIRTTKTIRQGEETNEDAIGEIFMTHPYEDYGWERKLAKRIQVMDAESIPGDRRLERYLDTQTKFQNNPNKASIISDNPKREGESMAQWERRLHSISDEYDAESEDDSVKIEFSNPFSTGFFAAIGVTVGLVTTAVAGALIVAGAVGNE